jgi:ABC-type phosphate transport system substrate-binding protein
VTLQASASGSTEPHKKTEPPATIQVAAGSSVFAPVTETGSRHESAQKTAGTGQGWPGLREKVAGTGTEQTRFRSRKQGVTISCDAKCDAISADRIELLARAVILVAGINLADAEQAALFARVVADLTSQRAAAGAAPHGRLPVHELLP